jgi:hypothetical protein
MTRFRVIWGCERVPNIAYFFTDYHAAQFLRALQMNGTPALMEAC